MNYDQVDGSNCVLLQVISKIDGVDEIDRKFEVVTAWSPANWSELVRIGGR